MEIANAYEVLSDEDARKRYDMYGKGGGGGFGGFNRGGGFGGGSHTFNFGGGGRSAHDIFKEAFGDEDPFADFEKEFAKSEARNGGMGGGPRVRMGGMGGASTSFSSSFSFSMGGGATTTQRSETRIDSSGRRVTKTVKTGANGETEAEMELDDGQGNVRSRKVSTDGKKKDSKPASLDDKEARAGDNSKPDKEPEAPPQTEEDEKPKKKKKTKKKKKKASSADADL